ncbi:MAG: hypothetical protein QM667_06905 [Asticcacaulis sp.]
MNILDLDGKHSGETIFIIGSGPALNFLQPEDIHALSQKITIGTNRVQYKVPVKYFVSSYPSEVLLASQTLHDSMLIHTRPTSEALLKGDFVTLKRVYSERVEDVPEHFDPETPYLVTRNNVVFLMTNLALIMGAKRLVYLGCEQRNGLHYYNQDDEALGLIVRDMCRVVSNHYDILGIDHPYEVPLNIMRGLLESPDVLRSRAFYAMNHFELISQWVSRFSSSGVEFFSAVEDSIFVDAGASFIDIKDALNFQ